MSRQRAILRHVESQVRHAVATHGLWRAGASLVVAVSGGPDSLCLLGVLLALRMRHDACTPGEIVVAHLDHGLRGRESAADAAWVAAFAGELGMRCVIERADVRTLARHQRRSLEDTARRVRYAFLRRVRADVGAERICVGHTRDDQAETVLMNLLRGAGLAGLSGMAPLERDVARPLLAITRDETLAYCDARGWKPLLDPTNDDLDIRRNRVRHELLPLLRAYNPAITRTLADNAALIASDERYLDAQTDAAWQGVLVAASPERVTLATPPMRALPLALRHRIFRRLHSSITSGGDAPAVTLSARAISLLDHLIDTPAGALEARLPGGVRARRVYERLLFEREAATIAEAPLSPQARAAAVPLVVPGVAELPELGWRVRAWRSDLPAGFEPDDGAVPPCVPAFSHAADLTGELGRAETRVHLDAAAVGDTLTVRAWQPGDRMRPLGLAHEKKLQDVFADAKVPRALRHTIPVVLNQEHVVWLAGLRIDHRARLTGETRDVLVLQLEPLASDPSPALDRINA